MRKLNRYSFEELHRCSKTTRKTPVGVPCAFLSGTDYDWYICVLSKVIFSACHIRDLICESKKCLKGDAVTFAFLFSIFFILYFVARTACVVCAMYVKTVQIQNFLQKSGLDEVPPKKEFNNIMVFTALVNSLNILL